MLSIKRKNPLNEITTNDVLEFTVLFSEAVENVLSTDFESILGSKIIVTKETDAKYSVTISDLESLKGLVSLNVKITNAIQDKASNLLLNSVFNPRKN